MNEIKTCKKCLLPLNKIDNFYRQKTSKDGFATICKTCVKFNKPRKIQHRQDNLLLCLICKNYKEQESFSADIKAVHRNQKYRYCKKCHSECLIKRRISRRGNQSLERLLVSRILGARNRAKGKNLDFCIDKEFLLYLWNKQNRKCAISQIEMSYKYYNGRVPTNLSIDRIDPTKGYTKENIQLVCMAVNQMKNDLTMDELLLFCKAIVNNN